MAMLKNDLFGPRIQEGRSKHIYKAVKMTNVEEDKQKKAADAINNAADGVQNLNVKEETYARVGERFGKIRDIHGDMNRGH